MFRPIEHGSIEHGIEHGKGIEHAIEHGKKAIEHGKKAIEHGSIEHKTQQAALKVLV